MNDEGIDISEIMSEEELAEIIAGSKNCELQAQLRMDYVCRNCVDLGGCKLAPKLKAVSLFENDKRELSNILYEGYKNNECQHIEELLREILQSSK